MRMVPDAVAPSRHTLVEDVFAILVGTAMIALGVSLFTEATLITGSTAGLALLLHYATGVGFGPLFFVINLPFYVLAVLRMGWPFTAKTVASVGLVSLFSSLFPLWLQIDAVAPLFAALVGGSLLGLGMLLLFRHKSSVGGSTSCRCTCRSASA